MEFKDNFFAQLFFKHGVIPALYTLFVLQSWLACYRPGVKFWSRARWSHKKSTKLNIFGQEIDINFNMVLWGIQHQLFSEPFRMRDTDTRVQGRYIPVGYVLVRYGHVRYGLVRFVPVQYVPVRYFPTFLRPRTFHPWISHNQQNSFRTGNPSPETKIRCFLLYTAYLQGNWAAGV